MVEFNEGLDNNFAIWIRMLGELQTACQQKYDEYPTLDFLVTIKDAMKNFEKKDHSRITGDNLHKVLEAIKEKKCFVHQEVKLSKMRSLYRRINQFTIQLAEIIRDFRQVEEMTPLQNIPGKIRVITPNYSKTLSDIDEMAVGGTLNIRQVD